MKTTKKRTRSIKPTLTNTKKRKAYKGKKRTTRKSMNKKYTSEGGGNTPKKTLRRSSNPSEIPQVGINASSKKTLRRSSGYGFGFSPAMPNNDDEKEIGFGFGDEVNCNVDPDLQPRKITVCNTCIPYLKKIFILRYNELIVYIKQIESAIKTNYESGIINKDSFDIYSGFIEELKKQCKDIYDKATDVNKTYNLEDWINYINRVGGKKGEIATRLDEQIYGVSIKPIGNVRKHEDKAMIPLPKSVKKSKTLRALFGNTRTTAVRPVIQVLHRNE
jgi:hypothetical protein